jgi:hypothetical protein
MFKWIEDRYKGSVSQSKTFIDHLISSSENDIKEYKVSIPISFLFIQAPFIIGKVTFEFFAIDFFDELEAHLKTFNQNDNTEGFKKFRKKYQGVVFASTSIIAEQEKAVELAIQETEKALMVLRLLSPTTYIPQIPSYFGRMGFTHVPISHCFIFADKFPIVKESVAVKSDFNLKVNSEDLNMMKLGGLDYLSQLISKSDPNEFERLLLNSISIFTKGIVSSDLQDKFVFSLASIETLLLADSSEPIQHSVGLRLAFGASRSREERKQIIQLVKRAYTIRSSYLHHGKASSDMGVLTGLQHTIVTALRNIMMNSSRFSNQAQLIDFIENMILS